MITLLIVIGALFIAAIGRTLLDPKAAASLAR
jgi:hypothetical protein